MKKLYILNTIICALLSLVMTSCYDDMKFIAKGEPQQIQINATTGQFNEASRAVFGHEDEIATIAGYTFLYYETSETGKKVLSHKVYSEDIPFTVTLNCPGDQPNLAILIANTPEGTFDGLALGSEITELNNYTHTWEHTYNAPSSSQILTWSDSKEVTYDTRQLEFSLNPNVAKVTLTIIDNTSDSQTVNLRVKRIRDKVRYAQNALYETGYSNEQEIPVQERGYFSYDMENMTLSKNADNSYSWYVPHNEPYIASNDANEYSRETGRIPSGSTFIEIDDLKTDGTNLCTSYRIYPGLSEEGKTYETLKNFNVVADEQYHITVTINNDGISIESTTNLKYEGNSLANTSHKIKLPEKNNCYMIHPRTQYLNTTIVDKKYKVKSVWELPIHQRINEYWGNETGTDAIDKDTEWQAEVIWQDIKGRAFHFTDEYANSQKDIFREIGQNPIYFMLDSETLDKTMSGSLTDETDIYGNVLIGVKKVVNGVAQDKYLWSWHLWITDYNPDAAPAYTEGLLCKKNAKNTNIGIIDMQGKKHATSSSITSYTELLFDGNVQHYNSMTSFWTSKTPTATDVPSYNSSSSVWDGSGIYAKKWIMDRNIGAQASNNSSIENPHEAYGLYYQYGRKDPFSYKTIYDINGQNPKTSHWTAEDTGNSAGGFIKNGIQDPQRFYTTIGKTVKWDKLASSNPWFNPDWNQANYTRGKKTLFDPCPPGWCIPVHEAFSFAVATNSKYALGSTNATQKSHSTVEIRINNPSSNNSSPVIEDPLRGYCDFICTSSDDNCIARIPLAGYIEGNTSGIAGTMTGFTTHNQSYSKSLDEIRGCLWTLEHDNDGSAKLIQIQPTSESFNGTTFVTVPELVRGRYYKNHGARVAIREWCTARGQNVRCIQIPD